MQPSDEMPCAVLDVELGLAERRRDLVLDDLHAHPVADRLGALLEGLDAADVEPLRRIELERAAARLGLRRAEHHADLLADLVGEHAERVGAVQVAGQLAHGLAHHARLEADASGRPSAPSSSAFGVSAATESIATTSTAPERISMSAISSACSP